MPTADATYVQQQWPTKYETWLDGIEEEMEKRIESGELFKADTLEDLADQLGIPADKFCRDGRALQLHVRCR